jgi:hypothetical protein
MPYNPDRPIPKPTKLLDQVRQVIRLKHMAISTEESYQLNLPATSSLGNCSKCSIRTGAVICYLDHLTDTSDQHLIVHPPKSQPQQFRPLD